ncbi:hypothetical protein PVT67_15260 [Gallaecimonas kandeliae]|uniref:hypothetical protein n=1 Tax=Gallaecimonas kandeliae TaxID=3029055 RepID=UPI002649273A|nr:hypothetical protein [Gallaecimonas kandeliae]WKE65006.1 hypothetical protein PVT67_15260 [Gallaecimonas kandeliae]
MRFKTLGDVFEHLTEAHQALAKLYKRLVANCDSERTRMMLHYLAEHEQQQAEHFTQYLKASHPELGTWFDKAVDTDFIHGLNRVSLETDVSQQDVLELALKLDNELLAELEALVPLCPGPSSRELLEGTLKEARARQHQLVHQTMRMEDL